MIFFQSIKGRLTFSLVAGLMVMYLCAGVAFYQIAKSFLTDQFDDQLTAWVNNISEMFDFEEGATDDEFQNTIFDNQYRLSDKKYYQVWTDKGTTVSKSLSLESHVLPFNHVGLHEYGFLDINLPGGVQGRGVVFSYVNHRMDESLPPVYTFQETHNTLVIMLAHSRENLDEILMVILVCLVGVGAVIVTGSGLIIQRSVKQGLTPLHRIAERTAGIDSDNLAQRFTENRLPEELKPITQRLDDMLGRLEKSFSREKRFTANVAHELRTPIAELRALAEVGLQEDLTGFENIRPYFQDALSVAIQMQGLTESLLTLARIDAGNMAVSMEDLNLEALVSKIVKLYDAKKGARNLETVINCSGMPVIRTDRMLLTTVFTNIISNALSYSPDGTTTAVSLSELETGYCLRVSNQVAKDLSPDDLSRMFEPFWRRDDARSDLAHSGLGLAIVKSCCRLLHISIEASRPSPEVFTLSLFMKEV
ncbi:MAG: hypothetical protein GY737_08020 [Desulfobacteraceae bacterium]|nr:hypothetical protein [Desulfobacteraceae bacterium]